MRNRTIICFANNYFFDPTSKHHIMAELAKTNYIVWVNWHASRRPSLSRRDLSSITEKLTQWARGAQRVGDRFWVVTPLVVPLPGSALAERINRAVVIAQITKLLRRLPKPRQLWTFTPDVAPIVGSFRESKVVYYCVDEFSAFPGYDVETISRYDSDMCRLADVVITSSRSLYNSKRVLNINTHEVPHGVRHRHFAQALDKNGPIPPDVHNIRQPVVGYYGLISDWQDWALVQEIARIRRDWSFALLGKITTNVDALKKLPNVHFLGQKPHCDLPDYCRAFDVALIPHKVNRLTVNMNPIKLREYLAAGLPVVSSPLPEVERYQPHVTIARTVEEWITRIEAALADRSAASDYARSQVVATEDWSVKVATLSEIINGSHVKTCETAL